MPSISYSVDENDILAFQSYHHFKNKTQSYRVFRRHHIIWPMLVFCTGIYLWLAVGLVNEASIAAIVAMAWSILVPMYLNKQTIKKIRLDNEATPIIGDYTLTINDDHLESRIPAGESKINWSKVWSIQRSKEHAFIYLSLNGALIIPLENIESGDAEAFINRANKKIDSM